MNDDNPLWYDHEEPDQAPGRALLVLASLFGAAMYAAARLVHAYRAPDRFWNWTLGAFARRQRVGAPRP